MKIKLDENAIMPSYAHDFDAGLDLHCKNEGSAVCVPPFGGFKAFDTGVHMAIPPHFCGLVKTRSSMLSKGIKTDGLVDADYTGSIRVKLYNHEHEPYKVERGDKIGQVLIIPVVSHDLVLVDSLEDTERGSRGFGSTGR